MAEPKTRAEIEALSVGRAWKDDAFRAEFLANPKATIEKYTGAALPATLKIHAHQEDANTLHFRLPQPPAGMTELSDADLEKVAGGTGVVVSIGPGIFAPVTVTGVPVITVQPTVTAGGRGW